MTKIPLLGCLIVFTTASARANLESPFPSTVDGVTIHNTHVIAAKNAKHGGVLRGSHPEGNLGQLIDYGVTDVLIFKDENENDAVKHTDVAQEINTLSSAYHISSPDRVLNIPFPWKDFPDFRSACQQTTQGLGFLVKAYNDPNRTVFFHCTVGEDRTGYLAGLFRMLTEGMSARSVFNQEMCRWGYSAGNPNKPAAVTDSIDQDMTPIFLKMAQLIQSGQLSSKNLDSFSCPDNVDITEDPSTWKCSPQSL